MIRIETSRQTVVTFKTEKGALNRVARDAEWFANAANPGEVLEVQVTARYDAEAARTLFDVDYVVYAEVAPQDVPEGAQGQVSGTRRNHLGQAVPYGYAATVVALHEPTGRLRLLNYTGTLVQREDEVLTLLPGSLVDAEPVTDLHLEDGSCCEEDDEDALGECPRCGDTTFHNGEQRHCQNPSCEYVVAPATAQLAAAPSSSYTVVRGDEDGNAFDRFTVTGWVEALDAVRSALVDDLDGTLDVKVYDAQGVLLYDVDEHDTCSVHRDAVFSKDGPCPVCVEEDDAAAQGRPCDACGALPREECRPDCIGLAAHEDDAQAGGWRDAHHADIQQHTVDTLRALLEGDLQRERVGLEAHLDDEQRAALSTAIAVLEG